MRAAILVTGDEILRGRIQERNAGLIARSLEPLGVEVERVAIVGDDLDGLVRALEDLLAGPADLICTTGGLGPTHDDLTMEAVARATGRRLLIDAGALAMVEARHAGIGVDAATRGAVQEKQASLPAGAVVLPPVGTAPGCLLEHEGRLVVVLPGPPWELEAMWEAALAEPMLAALVARADAPRERVLRLFAVPESRVVEIVAGLDADAWGRLRVGVCARDAELEVTVRATPGEEWAADALEERLRGALGDALYSRDASVDEVVAARPGGRRADRGGGRVVHRRRARGAAHGPARFLRLRPGRGDLVRRRGEALGARRGPGGDPPPRSRLAGMRPRDGRGGAAAGGRRLGALGDRRSPGREGVPPTSPSGSSTWAAPAPTEWSSRSSGCGATAGGSGSARWRWPCTCCGAACVPARV